MRLCGMFGSTFLIAWSLLLAQQVVATITPPAYPLAVKAPYLSAWMANGDLNGAWPTFWDNSILGWAGYVRVDNEPYIFLGVPSIAANKTTQKNAIFTSTQSIFTMTAGPVTLNVTFLNPVEANNLTLQSLPFTYFSLSVSPNDGASHSIQVYSDVSGEWLAENDALNITWSTSTGSSIITHQSQLEIQQEFTASKNRILQGTFYFSTSNSDGLTWQTGQDILVRQQFVSSGKLNNAQDTNFRAINDSWPMLAFAKDFGTVSSGSTPSVLFTLGHVRDPLVQYIVSGGQTQNRSAYYWSSFSNITDVINFHYNDYSNALSVANDFDSKLNQVSSNINPTYAQITALSVAQTLSWNEITISKDSSGNWNTSDVLVFNANGAINTADTIYAAWPTYLYTNPAIGGYLLRGLLEYQATGQYPNPFAVHDLGSVYPNATGHNDGNDPHMPLEESGNMLIMTYSHYLATKDSSYITQYYSLLDKWAQYLVANTLYPASQDSTDNFEGASPNQTNLAIKGVIGIGAMAKMASLMGYNSDASNYSSTATSYTSQILQLATSSDNKHLMLFYEDQSSWGLMYNLFGDKLLQLNLFPDSVYTMLDNYYTTVQGAYGVPLDSRHSYTLSEWEAFQAAVSTSTKTRDEVFLNSIFQFALSGKNSDPFPDMYDTTSGALVNFQGRCTVGGHLALLVVNGSSGSSSTSTASASPSSTSSSKSGASALDSTLAAQHVTMAACIVLPLLTSMMLVL